MLSIAGSDSGGGAGIQADLKAFAACGVHGMTAITAVTAQNTVGVSAVHQIPPAIIVEQVKQVVDDIGVDAVKIGMLGDPETIEAVVESLAHVGEAPVVVDPVMVSESGSRLLADEAVEALRTLLLPLAAVVTPNVAEAEVLAAHSGDSPLSADQMARGIHALGSRAVVVTGGHRAEATDVFFDGERLEEIPGERHESNAAHGSGCTHSSALAALLARGAEPLAAARKAKEIAARAVRDGLAGIGEGAGPVHALGIIREP